MEPLLNALPWVAGGLFLVLLLAVLRKPLSWLGRLAARTGVGLGVLWVLRWAGGILGLQLGVNLTMALLLALGGRGGCGLLGAWEWMLPV